MKAKADSHDDSDGLKSTRAMVPQLSNSMRSATISPDTALKVCSCARALSTLERTASMLSVNRQSSGTNP